MKVEKLIGRIIGSGLALSVLTLTWSAELSIQILLLIPLVRTAVAVIWFGIRGPKLFSLFSLMTWLILTFAIQNL